MIQPNNDLTSTGSDCVGIVMLTVRFVATKPVKGECQSLMFLLQISAEKTPVSSKFHCAFVPISACCYIKSLWQEIWRSNALQTTEIVEERRLIYHGPLSVQAVIRSVSSHKSNPNQKFKVHSAEHCSHCTKKTKRQEKRQEAKLSLG